MKRLITAGLTAGLLLVSACGSDDDGGTDGAAGDITSDESSDGTAAGDDLSDLSIPEGVGLSEDCRELYQQFLTAYGSVGGGATGFEGFEEAFSSLADAVPDDLSDDVEVMAEAFGKYEEVLADYDGDITKAMADPAAQEALSSIGSPEFMQASDNISAYFEETCPDTGG